MTRATITWGILAAALVLLAVAAGYRAFVQDTDPAAPTSPAPATPAITPSTAPAAAETYQGFLYGRVDTAGGVTYEGRLRWGGNQEAFWGDYFNGFKDENPWVAHVPPQRLAKERRPVEIFGIKIAETERELDMGRPFMARYGDIGRIEALGRDVRVTLKSGTVFVLDRFEAGDFDDGVRVWDARRGVVDLHGGVEREIAGDGGAARRIRTIELLPTAPLGDAPSRLRGTVRTRQGDFTGFVQWDREEGVGSDELDGHTAEGELGLRFDTIRSIARRSRDSSLVTLRDGRELVLSDTREVGHGNRGVYVDDPRYGRVLISWDAFERIDFSPGGSGPAYAGFPPGRPLNGTVVTRDGRRLVGRLVYDLDESETTETLDAQSQGVDYTIPFGLIASILPLAPDASGVHGAKVILDSGEELQLDGSGDVGGRHGGVLVFSRGRERPEYIRWDEVQRIDLDRPPAIDPPLR
jgi:hypothetical protein